MTRVLLRFIVALFVWNRWYEGLSLTPYVRYRKAWRRYKGIPFTADGFSVRCDAGREPVSWTE